MPLDQLDLGPEVASTLDRVRWRDAARVVTLLWEQRRLKLPRVTVGQVLDRLCHEGYAESTILTFMGRQDQNYRLTELGERERHATAEPRAP